MNSQLLTPQKESLKTRRAELVEQLAEVTKEHEQAERIAQAKSRASMKLYYQQKEIESAIEKVDEAIVALDSVESTRWP